MSFSASVVHRELDQKISVDIQQSTTIEIEVLGGDGPFTRYYPAQGGGFNATIDFDVNLWNGPTHSVRFGLSNQPGLNASLPDMGFDVAIDNVAPRIEFQSTS